MTSSVLQHIRNFAIIAHIDHGKSTLADRLIEKCTIHHTLKQSQMLDSMDLERERGITIKAQTVRLNYYDNEQGITYQLNLIDTPGHVDFAYEVSRSLSACEGAILLVDASQGVEAQTLANVYQAIDHNLEILVILNKIDLPAAEPARIRQQIENVIGLDASDALEISAKTGIGIESVLDAIVKRLPGPRKSPDDRLQALLIDSWYDTYLGVVSLIRVKQGVVHAGMTLRMMSTKATCLVDHVGIFAPEKTKVEQLSEGEVGYVITNIRKVADCRVGDTLTNDAFPVSTALPGFKPSIPVVFCGLFPSEAGDYDALKTALEKLQLNDSSFTFELESSSAFGMGFRCGFLGLLHLEIVQERLLREFNLQLITTAPSVIYHIHTKKGAVLDIHNPANMPDPVYIDFMEEPWILATIMMPDEYLGAVLSLCTERRGIQKSMNYVDQERVVVTYRLPLNEIVFDFYDRLKSVSRGYASFEYHADGYETGDLVKMTILVNGDSVEALSLILHRSRAAQRGRAICAKLKDLIPRQLFRVALQAAIGGKIIARETVSAVRKDVTAKCYGGDISRKRKLLEKQKAGKKRMQMIGNIEVPGEAMIAALKATQDA